MAGFVGTDRDLAGAMVHVSVVTAVWLGAGAVRECVGMHVSTCWFCPFTLA